MVKLEQIKNQVAGWVEDRAAKPGAAPVAEALAFMLATLRENTFETPKRWTNGKETAGRAGDDRARKPAHARSGGRLVPHRRPATQPPADDPRGREP